MKGDKSDWYIPRDWFLILSWHFLVPIIGITIAMLLPALDKVRTEATSLFYTALILACIGAVLLFLARLPLYRQHKFFAFGPRLLSNGHRRLYWFSYGIIGVAVLLLAFFMMIGIGLSASGMPPTEADLTNTIAALTVLQKPLEKPSSSDWLAHHPEKGQTFREYISAVGPSAIVSGKRIYIQPLGDFLESQWKVLTTTADYLRCFYNLPVTIDDAVELSSVPAAARRQNPNGDQEQILTTYVLDRIARPNVPPDAAAYLVLTTSDLWAGDDWNFVFGQASLKERVGVFSLYRNGNPDKKEKEYRLYLLRTMKTAAHEVGHMLGLQHCVRYRCGMNGSNHRAEADRRPLWFCSECTAKVCWITQTSPLDYCQRLEEFCEREGFHEEAEFYRKSKSLLLSLPYNAR